MTSPGIWGRKIYFCETLLYRRNSIQTLGVYISIMLLLLLWWIKATSPRVSNTEDHFLFSCQCCIQRGHRAPGRWMGLPEIIMQVINGKSEFFFDISRLYTPTNYYPSVNLESIYRWIYYSWPVFVKCCNVLCKRYLLLSFVQLSVTPWTVDHQVPLPMWISRQEYWNSGLPLPPLGHHPKLSCISCIGRQTLYHSATWKGFKDANGIN